MRWHIGLPILFLALAAPAREVGITLWISGGMDGVMMGDRASPGYLSAISKLMKEDPEACWIDVGGTSDWECLNRIEDVKLPDMVIPRETGLRMHGASFLQDSGIPWTCLNVAALPQFPDQEPEFPPDRGWEQADGARIRVVGLLADGAPLRVPSAKLHPFQVLPSIPSLRDFLTEQPIEPSMLSVLALPEQGDPTEWSRLAPDFAVLIAPPSTRPQVVTLRDGKQLRVTPGLHGRALIRVQLYWDTVERRFRDPKAEVVWMRLADVEALDLPECVVRRLRPVDAGSPEKLLESLLEHADAVWFPDETSEPGDSRLPDAQRVAMVPEDDAWLRVSLEDADWRRWRDLPDAKWRWMGEVSGSEVRVLLPARVAAGEGDWQSTIRRELVEREFQQEWMPFSTRELAVPIRDTPQ
ncbi:MAG: hypothetical protein PF795_15825 [Kiritimatiellae bacterium]|jgi:hypothetical protein|nr:hypothetical protein [Kiritimatiellia bacterium]